MRLPRAKGLANAFLSALFVAAMAFGAATIGQFGISKDTERLSDDAAQYLAAPFYARGLGGRTPVGQGRISVIYLDEAGLEKLEPLWTGFPPSYANQAQLVGDVVNGAGLGDDGQFLPGPRAVFIDFIFLAKGRNPDEFAAFANSLADATHAQAWRGAPACLADELVKLACMRAAGGTPVILAGDKTAPMSASQNARDDLLASAAMASVSVDARAYPLLARDGGEDSPAALLYAADCLAASAGCIPKDGFAALQAAADRLVAGADASAGQAAEAAAKAIRLRQSGNFAVRWSDRQDLAPTGPQALTKAVYGQDSPCRGAQGRESPAFAFAELGHRIAAKLTPMRLIKSGPDPKAKISCPYALSLSYGDMVTRTALSEDMRKRLFSDQLVLIGGQFANSNDWVPTPVQGEVAGVHYHAMALDNLLEFRSHGSTPPRTDKWTWVLTKLVGSALILVLVFMGNLHRIERNDFGYRFDHALDHKATEADKFKRATHLALMYVRFMVSNLATVVLALVIALHFHFPMNWILISGVVLGKSLYSVRKIIGKDLQPLTDALPWNRALRWIEKRLSLEHEILHDPLLRRRRAARRRAVAASSSETSP